MHCGFWIIGKLSVHFQEIEKKNHHFTKREKLLNQIFYFRSLCISKKISKRDWFITQTSYSNLKPLGHLCFYQYLNLHIYFVLGILLRRNIHQHSPLSRFNQLETLFILCNIKFKIDLKIWRHGEFTVGIFCVIFRQAGDQVKN